MKKIYADLHLCPNLKNVEHITKMINKASRLGYNTVAVNLYQNYNEQEIRKLQGISEEANIDLISRIDLKPKTPRELIYNLRKLRRRLEVIAVICESKNIARHAAKDRRVDLLNFPSLDFRRRFFDKAEAELASNSLTALEIDIKPLLILDGPSRIRLLSNLRRETIIAQKFHVPIVISSGVSDIMLMRKPKELVALASLFDLDEASARKAVSENPTLIIKRNREKLNPRFVAPGIRIIREGKDC
jgi:RNase P/RNase MRP subunit p30